MKFLKVQKAIPRNNQILHFFPFVDKRRFIRAKSRIGTRQLDFNAKHPILLHWKYHVVDFFLRNEPKDYSHEGTEHKRSIVQQRFWVIGVRNALFSLKNRCITCRKGRAQTMFPVMAELPIEMMDASTAFENFGIDYFGPFTVKFGRGTEKLVLVVHLSNSTSHTHRDSPKVGNRKLSERNYSVYSSKKQTNKKWSVRTGQTSLDQAESSKSSCRGMKQRQN